MSSPSALVCTGLVVALILQACSLGFDSTLPDFEGSSAPDVEGLTDINSADTGRGEDSGTDVVQTDSSGTDGTSDAIDVLDTTDVLDESDVSDTTDLPDATDVSDTTDLADATDATDVSNATDVLDAADVSDGGLDVDVVAPEIPTVTVTAPVADEYLLGTSQTISWTAAYATTAELGLYEAGSCPDGVAVLAIGSTVASAGNWIWEI